MVVIPSIFATGIAFWLTNRLTPSTRSRRAWLLLSAGLMLLTFGSLDRLAVLFSLNISPTWLTIIKTCYLAGQFFLLGSLLAFPLHIRRNRSQIRFLGDLLIAVIAAMTLGWLLVLRPILDSANRVDIFHFLLFPSLDLLLLQVMMVIFMLADLQKRSPGQRLINLGVLLFSISDLTRNFQAAYGGIHPASLVTLIWIAGCVAIALAAVGAYKPVIKHPETRIADNPATNSSQILFAKLRKVINKVDTAISKGLQSGMVFLTSFLLGGYALSGWSLNGRSDVLALWMTLLLGLFLIARQGMLAGEREFRQYTLLVNSIAEPAFICDGKGRLKLVNPALLSSMGYSDSHALLEKPMFCLVEDNKLPENLLQTALSNGWSGETVFKRMDGQTYPGNLSLRPIHRTFFERLALAGTAHDLSIQKAQQKALQEAYDQVANAHRDLEMLNAQLEQKVAEKTSSLSAAYQTLEDQNKTLQMLDELKSDFVSLVSHELRAPLTNISGGIELVLSSPQTIPDHVQLSLNLVQSEIRRLTHFVETILDLSALDAGRMPFTAAPMALVDIVDALDNQIKMVRSGERVRWSIPGGLPLINSDEHALESILFHLVDNAIKYAPQGEIRVSAHSGSGQVFVKVCDQGPGIPPEAVPLLFKKFYRLHRGDSQTVYGHGLGLYIVRRLLQAMDGDIGYESSPEGGACFTIWLPAIEDKDEIEIIAG